MPPSITGSSHSMDTTRGRSDGTAARDVGPDVVQTGGVQVDDLHRTLEEGGGGRADVVERDGADVAEILGDDHVGARRLQAFELDLVDGQRVPKDGAHLAVDLPAAPHRAQAGARQGREPPDALREVALVRDPHQVALRSHLRASHRALCLPDALVLAAGDALSAAPAARAGLNRPLTEGPGGVVLTWSYRCALIGREEHTAWPTEHSTTAMVP
jgi:hypothetical protein